MQLRGKVTDPATGDNIFEWVQTRETLFGGKYIHMFPPIVFNLKEDYGVNWNLFTDLIGVNVTHKKISGGHREKGVFLFDEPLNSFPSNITELHSFILNIFHENSSNK